MLQISNLRLSGLTVKLYFTFMMYVQEIIDRFEVVGEQFGYYVGKYKEAFERLNVIYLKYDPDFLTEKLQNSDDDRVYEYRRMREMIRYMSLFADSDEKKLVAGKLLKITDLYGGSNIPYQKVNERTASLVNLIEDFEEKHQEDVEVLGIAGLLESLKLAQGRYDELYMSRLEFDAENGKKAMDEARRIMDAAYRDLVTMVNMAAKRDSEGVLDDFINTMNVEIGKNRTYTGQGQVEGDSGSDSGDEVEDGDVEEDGTALFHYADHHEEEIRQLVGSLLTAPENTVGYKWSPAVPETMPAGHTSYYEIAVSSEEEEEDERPKYRVTYRAEGRVVATQEYYEGETIVPPECPEGFCWPDDVPEVMPARNIVIVAVEMD